MSASVASLGDDRLDTALNAADMASGMAGHRQLDPVQPYLDVLAGVLGLPIDHGLTSTIGHDRDDEEKNVHDVLMLALEEHLGSRGPGGISAAAWPVVVLLLRESMARGALIGAVVVGQRGASS